MGGLLQQNPTPTSDAAESNLRPVVVGIALLAFIVGILAFILKSEQKPPAEPPAYAAKLQFSYLKASAAENFAGATVNYLDGTITNTGSQTVTHALVEVTFKDDMGQVAQREELPIHILRTGGPYDEAVDLSMSPLAPGQSKLFRLTFESISAQWNHAYPDLKVTQVAVK